MKYAVQVRDEINIIVAQRAPFETALTVVDYSGFVRVDDVIPHRCPKLSDDYSLLKVIYLFLDCYN